MVPTPASLATSFIVGFGCTGLPQLPAIFNCSLSSRNHAGQSFRKDTVTAYFNYPPPHGTTLNHAEQREHSKQANDSPSRSPQSLSRYSGLHRQPGTETLEFRLC